MANPLGNMGRNILNQMQESLYMKPTPNRQIKNLQLEELRREKLEQENLRTAMSTYGAGLPPTAQAGFNALPLSIQQQVVAAPMTRTPQALPSNVMLYNHFKTDPTPEDGVITLEDQAQMDANMTAYGEFVQAVSPKGVTIDQRTQNYDDMVKTTLFEMDVKDVEADKASFNEMKPVMSRAKVMRLMLNNPNFNTGKMTEALLPVKQWFFESGLIADPSIPQQELFQAMGNYIVPRMRAKGSGSTSDKEIALFKAATATLGSTPEANRLVLDVFINTNSSDKLLISQQNKFLRKNGSLEGYEEYMSEEYPDEKTGLNRSRQEHIAPIFRSYNFEVYKEGKTDFELEKAAGYLKKGDLYYDERTATFKNLGFENDATTISSGGIK